MLSWASAVLILVLMLSHSWTCTVTVAPVAFSNAVLIAATALSLRSPSISQTVMALPWDAFSAEPAPQAETARATAAMAEAAVLRLDIGILPGAAGAVGDGDFRMTIGHVKALDTVAHQVHRVRNPADQRPDHW
ncbi:hypothetical protein GCM10018954_086090 [Kutzneria kofuensis]